MKKAAVKKAVAKKAAPKPRRPAARLAMVRRVGLSTALRDEFGGEVPGRLADLVTLPGVGGKTANVLLGNAFGSAGMTLPTVVA